MLANTHLKLPARLGGARFGGGHVAAEMGGAGAFRRQQLVGVIHAVLTPAKQARKM